MFPPLLWVELGRWHKISVRSILDSDNKQVSVGAPGSAVAVGPRENRLRVVLFLFLHERTEPFNRRTRFERWRSHRGRFCGATIVGLRQRLTPHHRRPGDDRRKPKLIICAQQRRRCRARMCARHELSADGRRDALKAIDNFD